MARKADSAAKAPAGGLTYKELSVKSEAYDSEVWQTIDDLYEGGFALKKNAARYLPQSHAEQRDRWKDRVAGTAYINYFAQIGDYFAAALFTQEISVREAPDAGNKATPGGKADSGIYAEFAKNADGKGTTLPDLLKVSLTSALNKGRALVAIDMPQRPAGVEIRSRADEEQAGLGKVYAYELPLEQVIDWDFDEDGGFSYLVIHRKKIPKAAPGKRTNVVVEEFKVWEKVEPDEALDAELGFEADADRDPPTVSWRLYRVTYPANKPPNEKTAVPLVDEGTVSFKRIPVLPLSVPKGLWLGNKIALMALEHYQGRSALNSAESRSLLAIPVVQHGSEFGAVGGEMPSEIQQNPRRGSRPKDEFEAAGVVTLGAGDKYGFWEPSGAAYEIKDRQLSALKDEMFRVTHQMALSVTNNAKTLARSGESKKEDRVAEGIVLGALGKIVRDFDVLLHTTISEARGEDVIWNAHGLDSYESEDRESLLEEAIAVDQIAIPSVTFKQFLKTQVAKRLCPNMSPETQEQMRKEIEAGTKAEESLRVDMHERDTAQTKFETENIGSAGVVDT